jgi:mannose-1-phosphate guanylyltransferase
VVLPLSRSITIEEDFIVASAADAPSNRVALLLAGGDGKRLQDLTREIAGTPIPKQYCRLLHGSSLLEATLSRAQLFAPRDRIAVIVNRNHFSLARDQLRALPESNIFVQPLNRDTGPGLAFALMQLEKTHPDAIVAVFPTDHYIDEDRMFIAHVLHAVNLIARLPDKIAILGVAPDRPETEYGYILPDGPLETYAKAYRVKTFTEKPTPAGARDILSRGGFWNTFVMVFKISRMLELLCEHFPDDLHILSILRDAPERAADVYQTIGSWNLSTQVLARIPKHLILVEVANVRWSDWGTRESVERTYHALNLVPAWNPANSVSMTDPR